jgi:hypothetical protein
MRTICLLTLLSLLAACADDAASPDATGPDAPNTLVYASREARQCEFDGIPPQQSAARLIGAGIDVLSTTCGHQTGIAYPAVCGAGTTDIIVHGIRTVNLAHAAQLGFSPVSTLVNEALGTNYELMDCADRTPVPVSP